MSFTGHLEAITNDLGNFALDETGNVGAVNIREDGQCLVHLWIEFRSNVFALK